MLAAIILGAFGIVALLKGLVNSIPLINSYSRAYYDGDFVRLTFASGLWKQLWSEVVLTIVGICVLCGTYYRVAVQQVDPVLDLALGLFVVGMAKILRTIYFTLREPIELVVRDIPGKSKSRQIKIAQSQTERRYLTSFLLHGVTGAILSFVGITLLAVFIP